MFFFSFQKLGPGHVMTFFVQELVKLWEFHQVVQHCLIWCQESPVSRKWDTSHHRWLQRLGMMGVGVVGVVGVGCLWVDDFVGFFFFRDSLGDVWNTEEKMPNFFFAENEWWEGFTIWPWNSVHKTPGCYTRRYGVTLFVLNQCLNSPKQWSKPWLFRVYGGLDYPLMWGLLISQYTDPY